MVKTLTGVTNQSITNTLKVNKVSANNSLGNAGQVLTSNGTVTYWATPVAEAVVNTAAQYVWTNTNIFNANVTVNAALIANGSPGIAGHVLHSNGTAVYWAADDTNLNTTYDLLAVANTETNKGIIRLKDVNNSNDDVYVTGAGGVVVSSNDSHIVITGQSGDITDVNAGSGLIGTTTSGAATLAVLANAGIIANATGTYVDQTYAYNWSNSHTWNKHLAIGNNATVDFLNTTSAGAGAAFNIIVGVQENVSGDLSGNTYIGVSSRNQYTHTGTGSVSVIEMAPYGIISNTSTGPVGSLLGTYSRAFNYGSGTVGTLSGDYNISYHYGSNTVTNMFGGYSLARHYGSGTITTFIGQGAAPAQIHGTGNVVTSTGLRIYSATANNTGRITGTNYGIYISNQNTSAVSTGALHYNLYSEGSNTFNIFEGRIGIGTTTPAQKLHVVGATSGSPMGDIAKFENTPVSGGYATISLRQNVAGGNDLTSYWGNDADKAWIGTSGAFPFAIFTNGTEKLRVTSAGNVGIGTTTPAQKLDVVGWTRIGLPGNDSGIEFEGGYGKIYRATSTGNIIITPQVDTVFSSGNVGISNTAPTHKLSVNGTSYFQANVTLNSALIANSSAGSAGEVLHSNGTATYWAVDDNTNTTYDLLTVANTVANKAIIRLTDSSSANDDAYIIGANGITSFSNSTAAYAYAVGSSTVTVNTSGIHVNPDLTIANLTASYANVTNDLYVGRNVAIQGNLTIYGTTTSLQGNTITFSDNMLYLNQGILATITNVSGNGTHVTFTANNNYSAGWDVVVTGVDPSSYNGTYQNIFSANATHFQVANTNTASYVSGGNARGKTDQNPDLGIAAGYNDGTYHHTGIFRDASDGYWKVFDGYLPEPDANINIDTSNASFNIAGLWAGNIRLGNTSVYATINSTSYSGAANTANVAAYVSTATTTNTFNVGTGTYFVSNGNVGIGTTSPTDKLTVRVGYASSVTNAIRLENPFDGSGVGGTSIFFKNFYNNALISAYSNPSGGQGGTLQLQSYNSDTTLNNGIAIVSNGNVGINTTSPSEKLHVYGSTNIYLKAQTTTVATAGLWLENSTGWYKWQMDSTRALSLTDSAGPNRIFVANNGNIGLGDFAVSTPGATYAPKAKLDVAGALSVGYALTDTFTTPSNSLVVSGNIGVGITAPALQSGGTGIHLHGTSYSEIKFTNGTTGNLSTDGTALVTSGLGFGINNREAGEITFGTSNLERMRISATGDVGIGTASPSRKLDVYGSGQFSDASGIQTTIWSQATSGTGGVGTNNNYPFTILTNGSERVRITSAGDVGIGTTAPGAKLAVVGTIVGNNFSTQWASTTGAATNIPLTPQAGGYSYLSVDNASGAPNNASLIRLGNIYTGTNNKSASWIGSFYNYNYSSSLVFYSGKKGDNVLLPYQSALNAILEQDVISFYTGAAGTGDTSERVRIDSAGNVGIGETNPLRKLTVRADSTASITAAAFYNADTTNNNGTVFSFRTDTTGTGATTFQEFAAIAARYEEHNHATRSGSLDFFTVENGTGVNRLRVAANGNIGIGTTSPSTKLHLVGTSGTILIRLDDAVNPRNNYIGVDNYEQVVVAANESNTVGATPNIKFRINASELMRILPSGNVGIGTTSPSSKLTVNGDIGASGDIRSTSSGANQGNFQALQSSSASGSYLHMIRSGYQAWYLASPPNSADFYISEATGNAADSKMYFKSGGNVGIGTTAPSQKLSVAGNAIIGTEGNSRIMLFGAGGGQTIREHYDVEVNPRWAIGRDFITGGQAGIGFVSVANGAFANVGVAMGAPSTSTLALYTSNGTALTERMRVTSTGNVGIGRTNPSYKLDVAGSTRVAGYLIGVDGTDAIKYLLTSDGGNSYISSNLGVANDAPTHRLSVNGTSYFQANVTLTSALIANGGSGSAGQVLHSNGTATYWASDDDTNTTYDLLTVANTEANKGILRLSASTLANDDTYFVGANGVTVVSNTTGVYPYAVGSSTVTVNTSGIHVNPILTVTDLTVSGNLVVLGDTVTLNVASVAIEDSLIEYARNQNDTATYTDALDIGFYGSYGNTANSWASGFFRDQSDSGIWKVFQSNGTVTNTNIDTANTLAFALAPIEASYFGTTEAGYGSATGGAIANATVVAVGNSSANVVAGYGTFALNTTAMTANSTLLYHSTSAAIGTTTATKSLTVKGTGLAVVGGGTQNIGNEIFFYRSDLLQMAYIGWQTPSDANSPWWFNNVNGNPTAWASNGTELMRLTATGNLGIGNTAPTETLQVNGNIYINKENSGIIIDSGNNKRVGFMKYGGHEAVISRIASQDFGIVRTGGDIANTTLTYDLYVSGVGDIGIATTAPGGTLGVNGSIVIGNQLTTGTSGTLRQITSGGITYIQSGQNLTSGSAAPLVFGNMMASSEWMRITSTGNVGIGTNAPTATLHVQGTSLFKNTGAAVTLDSGSATDARMEFLYNGTRSGFISVDNAVFSVTANSAAVLTLGANAQERMRIAANGNVGIRNSSPSTILTVNAKVGDDNGFTYDSNTVYITHQTPTSTTVLNDPKPVLLLARQGTGGQAYGAAAEFNLSRYENSSVNSRTRLDIKLAHDSFMTVNTTVMTMRSDGNIGIGTVTPGVKLDVNGDARIANGSSIYWYNYNSTTNGPRIVGSNDALSVESGPVGPARGSLNLIGHNNSTLQTDNGSLSLSASQASTSGAFINFSTAGSERMRIANTGNVGIGTLNPLAKVHVSLTGASTASITTVSSFGTNGIFSLGSISNNGEGVYLGTGYNDTGVNGGIAAGLGFFREASGWNTALTFYTNGTTDSVTTNRISERMRITSAGDVGIGTNAPLNYAGYTSLTIGSSSSVGLIKLRSSYNSGNGGEIYQSTGGITYFNTNSGANWMVSDASGNVGIGTTTTSYKLTVNGQASFNGVPLSEAVDYDESAYFSLQKHLENSNINCLIGGGTNPTFENNNNTTTPFSKIASFPAYYNGISEFIPVQPGERLYGEIYALRETGSTGTAGQIYVGIARYDKDKKPIATNLGLTYFVVSGPDVPQNSVWNKYSGYTTLPTSHTIFDGSDGGPVRYIRAYILVNYNTGTIPTKIGGFTIRKVSTVKDTGDVSILGNVGVGSTTPAARLEVKAATDNQDPIFQVTEYRTGGAALAKIYESGDAGVMTVGYYGLTASRIEMNGGVSGGASAITMYTGTNANVSIVSSGNSYFTGGSVGIGTNSPGFLLDVAGTSTNTVRVRTSGGDTAMSGYRFSGASTNADWTWGTNASNIGGTAAAAFLLNNTLSTIPFVVTSAGSVGVGATTVRGAFNIERSSTANTIAATSSIVLSNRNSTSGTFITGGVFSNSYRDINSDEYTAGVWFERQNSVSAGSNATQGAVVFGANQYQGANILPFERMRITAAGNVGIGTTNPGYTLQVVGSFAATTKSFVIDHPTKPNHKLRYGSLESPYHGVRLTGEAEVIDGTCTVKLPDYIHALCHEEGVNVQLTNIKHGKVLWVDEINIDNNEFTVATETNGNYKFYWSFTAIRKDIEDMVVEFENNEKE